MPFNLYKCFWIYIIFKKWTLRVTFSGIFVILPGFRIGQGPAHFPCCLQLGLGQVTQLCWDNSVKTRQRFEGMRRGKWVIVKIKLLPSGACFFFFFLNLMMHFAGPRFLWGGLPIPKGLFGFLHSNALGFGIHLPLEWQAERWCCRRSSAASSLCWFDLG